MITEEKLAIYLHFDGDDDGWARAGCPGGELFAHGDWAMIRDSLQELRLVKHHQATPEYEARIRAKLALVVESGPVAERLFAAA